MKQLIQRAAGSTFLRHNLIFFSGSVVVSFLNYLFYPVLGRLMTPADFGEVQAIIALFMQTGVFLQVFGLLTVAIIKKYGDPNERSQVLSDLERLMLWVGSGLFILTLLFSLPLQQFLHFQSAIPFILLALTTFIGIPTTLGSSYLQGLKRFGALAWSNIVPTASKLVLSAGLVLAGLRTNGAILGLALSQVINLVYTTILAARFGRPRVRLSVQPPDIRRIRPELRYAGLVLAASLCINVLLSIDIIAVKHYFDPHAAGLYAGISTIARIIFFLTGPLTAVLIASVKLGDPVHNRALLKRSLGMLVGLGGGTLLFFTLFPGFVIKLLLGSRYLEYASQLPRLSLAIFVLSCANLLLFYHLMLRHYRVVVAAGLSLVSMAVLIAMQHQSIAAIVNSLLAGSFGLTILIIIAANWKPKHGRG